MADIEPVQKMSDVSWTANGANGVTLNVKGEVPTAGWKNPTLVKSRTSMPNHLIFDFMGTPPTGMAEQTIESFSAHESLPPGRYKVTVNSKTNSVDTEVIYPEGDPK